MNEWKKETRRPFDKRVKCEWKSSTEQGRVDVDIRETDWGTNLYQIKVTRTLRVYGPTPIIEWSYNPRTARGENPQIVGAHYGESVMEFETVDRTFSDVESAALAAKSMFGIAC